MQQPLAKDSKTIGIAAAARAEKARQIAFRGQAMLIESFECPITGPGEEQTVSA